MASRKAQRSTPPPDHVVSAIRSGEPVDRDALMEWYLDHAPAWLRRHGVAADFAVLIWRLPDPRRWANLGVAFRE